MELKNKECKIINFTGKSKEKYNGVNKSDKLTVYQFQGNAQRQDQGQLLPAQSPGCCHTFRYWW